MNPIIISAGTLGELSDILAGAMSRIQDVRVTYSPRSFFSTAHSRSVAISSDSVAVEPLTEHRQIDKNWFNLPYSKCSFCGANVAPWSVICGKCHK